MAISGASGLPIKPWLRNVLAALACAGAALPLAGCASTITRHPLTLDVDTPDGIRTGPGAIQVKYKKLFRSIGASSERIARWLRGNAP